MTNKEKVNVIIDSNEESQAKEAVQCFVLHEDVETFTIEPLETGDFIVENCIFERKTPSDFASSLQEGRLREQVDRMMLDERRGFILIEGDMKDFSNLKHSQMPPKSLRGMTASIIGRSGIPVVFCSTPENLADIAIRIARKTIEDVNVQHIKNDDTVKDVAFIVKFFMNVEGIGHRTAEELSEAFPTVKSALKASKKDLASVGGIGDKRAENIYNTIHSGEDRNKTERMKPIKI